MIQAPNMQYIPAQTVMPSNNTVPGANNYTQNPNMPNNQGVFYNYPAYSCYNPQTPYNGAKSQFNGVNIEIFNPQGQASGMPNQNTEQVTMPAQFVPVQNPVVIPQYPVINQNPVVYNPSQQAVPGQVMPQQPVQIPAQAVSPNNVQVPAPQIQQPQQTPEAPVVEAPQAPDPSKSPETFAGRLKTDDLEAQNGTIEEIATAVKENPDLGPVLLDTVVFDELVNIINKDTSKLQGPTPEIIELRQKDPSTLKEDEKVKASTPTPLEQAERNKQHALYTISFMQELLNSEIQKRNGQALELKDLPCIDTVIEAAKNNPNPSIRVGAIASLSYIARPEYKDDLKTIFDIAKSDEDARVQEAAQNALNSLEKKAA